CTSPLSCYTHHHTSTLDLPRADSALVVFFFNDTATTEIYTLSLHDALPICTGYTHIHTHTHGRTDGRTRSEEHTSELQSHLNLVCRLLLEKRKQQREPHATCTHTTTRYLHATCLRAH